MFKLKFSRLGSCTILKTNEIEEHRRARGPLNAGCEAPAHIETGEERFLMAFLTRAYSDAIGRVSSGVEKAKGASALATTEAREWFRSDSTEICSFNWVVEALNLNSKARAFFLENIDEAEANPEKYIRPTFKLY